MSTDTPETDPVATDEPIPVVPTVPVGAPPEPVESAPAEDAESEEEGEAVFVGRILDLLPGVDVEPMVRGSVDKFGTAIGTGRRKTSVARVRIKAGSGSVSVNGRAFDDYFSVERDRSLIEQPLKACGKHGSVDVWIRVKGGGITGQTGAVVLGMARALEALDPNLHKALAEGGFLTRDQRMVERKKYGFRKARRSFQFSKR